MPAVRDRAVGSKVVSILALLAQELPFSRVSRDARARSTASRRSPWAPVRDTHVRPWNLPRLTPSRRRFLQPSSNGSLEPDTIQADCLAAAWARSAIDAERHRDSDSTRPSTRPGRRATHGSSCASARAVGSTHGAESATRSGIAPTCARGESPTSDDRADPSDTATPFAHDRSASRHESAGNENRF